MLCIVCIITAALPLLSCGNMYVCTDTYGVCTVTSGVCIEMPSYRVACHMYSDCIAYLACDCHY